MTVTISVARTELHLGVDGRGEVAVSSTFARATVANFSSLNVTL